MKKVLSMLVLISALLTVSCGASEDPIVGKWSFSVFGEEGWIDFKADGTFESDSGPGTWAKNDETIIFEEGAPNETKTSIVELSKDKMVLSYDDWGFEITMTKE